jgi:hypothetical protein
MVTDLHLSQIRPLAEDRYEVTFEGPGGATERVTCRVVEHKGVSAVRMEPDFVMGAEPPRFDSREVVAAVLELHRKRSGGPEPEPPA